MVVDKYTKNQIIWIIVLVLIIAPWIFFLSGFLLWPIAIAFDKIIKPSLDMQYTVKIVFNILKILVGLVFTVLFLYFAWPKKKNGN